MYELALIVFGFLLGLVPPWLSRKRRLKTHWGALKAEISRCREKAETLLSDNVQSPLYRLPLIAYEASYPVLLAEGAVDEDEVRSLGKFFELVEDINRGLDNAAEASMSGGSHKLKAEFNRNRLKANNLISEENGNPSPFDSAKDIVDRKVALKWWQ